MSLILEEKVAHSSYLADVNKIEAPSNDKNHYLAKRIAMGDTRAKNELWEINVRLVLKCAVKHIRKLEPTSTSFTDLVQAGNNALEHAIDKFDYEKGFRFSTYATWWINQGINREIQEYGRTIRRPVHILENIGKYMVAFDEVKQILKRVPKSFEVAKYLGIPVKKFQETMNEAAQQFSLDYQLSSDSGEDTSLVEIIPDKSSNNHDPWKHIERKHLRGTLDDVLSELSNREADILRWRFGLYGGKPESLQKIGDRFGVTRERIRQVEARALRKLRHPNRIKKLKDFHQE